MLSAGGVAGWQYLRVLSEQVRRLQGATRNQGEQLAELRAQSSTHSSEVKSALDEIAGRAPVAERRLEELSAQLDARSSEIYLRVRDTHLGLLRKVERLPGLLLSEQQAATQLLSAFPPRAPLPVLAGWAMTPSGLLWLVDYIVRMKPQRIVECGSGTTTLWMAMALERAGSGHLVSLEHSSEFVTRTSDLLAQHGVADRAEVRHAPLVNTSTGRGDYSWYSVRPRDVAEIDLLVVDGPPGSTGPLARYPAIPMLGPMLAPHAVVVVDDVDRKDEQEMVRLWLEDDPRLARTGSLAEQVEILSLQS